MSNYYLNAAYSIQLPVVSKSVLTALANRACDLGRCFPSVATISTDTGLCRSSVFKALGMLEKQGHISRTAQTRSDGSKRSNLYTLLIAPAKRIAKAGFEKAVKIAQVFEGKTDAKPVTAQIQRSVKYSASDFSDCNGFVSGFAQYCERSDVAAKKTRLVSLFKQFGFNSEYVLTCFSQYLGHWITWFNENRDRIDPAERDEFQSDFDGLSGDALAVAQAVTPS